MNKKVLAILLFAMLVPLLLMSFGTVHTFAQGTPSPSATQTPIPTPTLQVLGMFKFKVEDVLKFHVSVSGGKPVTFAKQLDGT